MLKDGLGEHSRLEEEYFYKKDRELIEKLKTTEEQKKNLLERTAHYHKCPKCGHGMEEKHREQFSYLICQHCASMHVSLEKLSQFNRGQQLKLLLSELEEQIESYKESA